MLGAALLLVVLNGLFVAAEFSFVKARRTRIEIAAAQGSSRAQSALFGLSHLDAYLSVCQLGITLASLGLGWIGEPAVAGLLRPLLEALSIDNPAVLSSLSVAIGFSIITLLHVVFGELAPKTVSIQKAEVTVLLLAKPMRFFYYLCFPLVTIMNGISNAVLRLAGIGPATESEQSHTPEELRMLIMDSSKGGHIDEGEGRMLDNIFRFYQKTAKDIMVHRMDAIALDVTSSPVDALAMARKSGHTRYPVYEDNSDNVIGFIHARDFLRAKAGADLRGILRTPMYTQETISLDKLLQSMQRKRQQFCVVLDEYAVWQGILTMEDIVEAIVGDIQDEFDHEDPDVVQESETVFVVSADLSIDDLALYMTLDCTESNLDFNKILAAHFMEQLGKIPEVGESILLCGKRFTVAGMERNRVRRIRVEEPS